MSYSPSTDGDQYCRLAGIPDSMTTQEAELSAENAVNLFSAADLAHLETGNGDQPEFDKFLVAEGFILLNEIIDGPVWD